MVFQEGQVSPDLKLKNSPVLKPGKSNENFLLSRKLGKTKYWINGIA